jgi:hypothetical protein
MDAAKCRSCNADIIWVVSAAGKPMPLDAKSEKRIVMRDKPGLAPVGKPPPQAAHIVDTYASHFSSCPNAAQHRKAR